jgi:hypothetical protein
MKARALSLLVGLAMTCGAAADKLPFRAGVARIAVQDFEPFDALVWNRCRVL